MFAMLPELTPRDSHSLWYTSPRNPSSSLYPLDPSHSTADNGGPQATTTAPATTTTGTTPNPTQNTPAPTQTATARQANAHSASATAQIIDRSALGRLQAEELLIERRRTAVTNLGSTWLKPVGVAKTLFQMREERREAEEHAEAMRREMLAQELADAAAQGAAEEEAQGLEGGGEDEEMMEEEDGGVDLDADIPDEDAGMGFGYDGASDEEEDEDEDEEEEGEEDNEDEEELSEDELERRQEIARIRATEARMREVSEQNDANLRRSDSIFDFDEEPSDEDRSQLLEEEGLVRGHPHPQADVQVPGPVGAGHDMDMDADLDDDIPEADGGGYEHTDSEASLDSGDEGHDISYARSSRMVHGRSSLRRSQALRSSLDISGLLSRDGSSMAGSSPHMRRGNY
ncbi:Apc15p protein-domain-containing protein [Parachaetomium inaequale]|uniref:Apc15p protein-domain-containing protein n=1 Tax=Parachaetomium inaequale TaxID=2588326 RepID=A0AAN6PD45_9PEZI|nr:Apc15p protein-domain-containing protein [Parachaetomium inaequale]